MCKHLGISALTRKRVKGDHDSAIKEHLLFCNHTPDFEDLSILATSNNGSNVTLMESFLRTGNLYLWNFLTGRN